MTPFKYVELSGTTTGWTDNYIVAFEKAFEVNVENFLQECKRVCEEEEGIQHGCGSYLFGHGFCGAHKRYVDDLIFNGCDSVSGRVDRDSVEVFDTCMFRGWTVATQRNKCRVSLRGVDPFEKFP